MARSTIAATVGVGSYPVLPLAANAADFTLVAANVADKNQASWGQAGRMLLFAINTHAANPGDITIESAPDSFNREGDITDYVLQAGDVAFWILQRLGWRQSDGMLYFDASIPEIKFGVILI